MALPKARTAAPWHFRLAKALVRRGIRGPGRWIRAAEALGLLNCLVRYELGTSASIDVPLYRRENQWDREEVLAYESAFLDSLAHHVRQLPTPVRLIDAGADIGLFTALLVMRCNNIGEVLAIEPNAEAFNVLAGNIDRLPIPGAAVQAAVSDFFGRGTLVTPETDPSQHAWFLRKAADGDVKVVTLDGLEKIGDVQSATGGSLVLKLDVEGSELSAIRGAVKTIAAADNVIVTVEAHPEVARRTGIDPIECFKELQSIRPFKFTISERPDVTLTLEVPYFDQLDQRAASVSCDTESACVHNVIARSVK